MSEGSSAGAAASAGAGDQPVPRGDAPIGGQAVLEGVMMRGVSTWAVAVRKAAPEQLERGDCVLSRDEVPEGENDVYS